VTPEEQKHGYDWGWRRGIEQAALWHDERQRAMQETADATADDLLCLKLIERANWHRDAAKHIREITA